MKLFYGVLCILGTALPLFQFIPWVYENGLNVGQFITEAGHTRISGFAWMDVIVSIIVLIGFILYEGRREGMKHLWLPIVGGFIVGASLGLPLFLLMREMHREGK